MIRFLIRSGIFVASAALGLLVAAWLLPEFNLSWSGGIVAVLVFAVIQSVISPFLLKVAARNAPAFLGGIGIVSTFVALFVASLFPGGLTIDGWRTWVLAPVLVWMITALATFFLPMVFLKKGIEKKRNRTALPIG
ncbi:phage holin family protein [Microterricola viridarii]|uniref:4 TMS phage holin, superfamily IV n=1 Tax=Microterricola viridarii TaxID=412690 RepID=A0A109QXH8_9MICO|nr:phage holin family protein [Microterricola viridarii]AMB59987.1 hypothetical protein AWU67_15240 [Microterricola viridarii]